MNKKKRIILIICISLIVIAAVIVVSFFILRQDSTADDSATPDEGVSSVTDSSTWIDTKDHSEHTQENYTLGTTAQRVKNELSDDFTINHKKIDDIPIYEMVEASAEKPPIIFFLHGQLSRKEESLDDMEVYVKEGYFCVAVDLQGHGERISDEAMMALEITKNTAEDLDVLLDYYESNGLADTSRFALIGFSQGGSVGYWYAVNGERTPSALVVGSTSPDYTLSYDDKCICNGAVVDATWSEKQINDFIEKHNPIDHADKLMTLPIMSGNSLDDDVVSYQGSEALEKKLKEGGNKKIRFYYFENTGHNVSEDFVTKTLPFIQEYL